MIQSVPLSKPHVCSSRTYILVTVRTYETKKHNVQKRCSFYIKLGCTYNNPQVLEGCFVQYLLQGVLSRSELGVMVRSDVAGEASHLAKGLTIQVLHTRTDRYTDTDWKN
jgi:hypothetical protein